MEECEISIFIFPRCVKWFRIPLTLCTVERSCARVCARIQVLAETYKSRWGGRRVCVCVCMCVRERVCESERERETRSLLVHFAVSCGRLLLAWRLVVAQGTLTRWIPKSVPLTCAVRSCHGFRGRIYYPNHTADLSADEWPLYLQ